MKKPNNTMTSALKPLAPVRVIDVRTGEVLSVLEYESSVRELVDYVTNRTSELFVEHEEQLLVDIEDYKGSANSYGRQKGYRIDYSTLPDNTLAKSRIQELVLHKLVGEVASFVKNPIQGKNKPSFSRKINLGAVNSQMVTLTMDEQGGLFMEWKCWDRVLLLEFKIPDYILKRNLQKITLPVVQITKTGKIQYYFTVQELIPPNKGHLRAGVDVGVVLPYALAVINREGGLVAQYTPSNRIMHLSKRVGGLRREKKNLWRKMEKRAKYGLDNTTLKNEYYYITRKITTLTGEIANQTGNEITKRLSRHPVSILALENLNWVSGFTGSKVGTNKTFQHRKLQTSIEHATQRVGIKTKKVNPRNTSQKCSKCAKKITHITRTRNITCMNCSHTINRDVNASINIAKLVRTVTRGTGQSLKALRMVLSTKDSPRSHSTRITT